MDVSYKNNKGFPSGSAGKEFSEIPETWVRSLGWEGPWRREQLSTPVFWLGEIHGLYSSQGQKELDTTEQLPFCILYKQ